VYARGLRADLIPTSHLNNEGIWHQVKRCLSSNKPSTNCPAVGLWLGSHPNWTAVVALNADGRILVNGRDSGRWAYFDDGELTLMWDDYAPERLKRTDDGFAEGGFSLVHLDSLPAQPASKEKLVTYGPLLPDSAFKPIADTLAVRRNWYFYQTPGNLGDKLIARGTHRFFSKLDRNVILNPMPDQWDPTEVGVIFAGGGNLGTYKNVVEAREQVLNKVRGSSTPVVVLPQSGTQKLEFSDVTTLFVRETGTQALYPGAILAPDMAMFATISAPEVTPQRKFGIFLRIDREGIIATKHGRDPYEMFSTLEESALAILRCRTIVTDRLHFAILALILKREVVLLPNSYHKNRSMYETWLKGLGCKWADDAVEWTGERTFKRADSKTQAQ
jgi:exopolysaccharide biosynthesis predicted pyruvyltransferase EpsI